ncbi:MAG: VPLPA-CTERM sorting domain-containing protein [Pseudomonadota bacterium]|nr:VPLPA-CTERM sorting domain-containing protein [Pseudomonadota bacterium]
MKKISLLAVCLVLFCTNAFAFDPNAVPDLEKPLGAIALDKPIQFMELGIMEPFYHKYTLTLPASSFSVSAVSLQFPDISKIEDFSAYLYKKGGTTALFEVTGASLIEKKIDLEAGDYFLALTGKGIGTIGGSYTGLLAATKPVPLPGAALFLGAGFLGLVGLRRRNLNA